MLLFLKRKTEETGGEIAAPAPPDAATHDFIPYHSHYNPHTLLTKNGELMQTIKIATNNKGLHYESGGGGSTVREAIREAIAECIRSDKFSLWIHTLRRRRDIRYDGRFKHPFAAYVHEGWQDKHRWKYQYYNEIYVTILREGQGATLLDRKAWRYTFLPRLNRRYRNTYLDAAYSDLDQTVSAMLQKIRKHYNAHRLTVAERKPSGSHTAAFYSEPMEFLDTLINLRHDPHLLPERDISRAISDDRQLTFGFNALESKDTQGHRRFAAMMTLKQYREMPPDTVDRVLQMPMELAVTQAFHFASATETIKQLKTQQALFDMSGDRYSSQASGLEEMLKANKGSLLDFGEHQTNIMVMTDEYKRLDAEVNRLHGAFAPLGLITVREDIRLEECFWAQLPGNFEFIRRRDVIDTGRIAGFCRLNCFPGGAESGNHWGDAVTLLPTMVGSPYFFNFHEGDNGHTLLADFNSFHDRQGQALLNFLLTSTLKYDGRIFVFDHKRSSRLFFDKLDASYHTFPGRLRLNPFSLDYEKHASFLLAWCLGLAASSLSLQPPHKETLRAGLDQLYAGPPEQRNLAGLAALLESRDGDLARAIAAFTGGGKGAGLFDASADNFDFAHPVQAFDMDPAGARDAAVPLFAYLLHRIIDSLDGRPTIIVLHDAVNLLENDFFLPRLESLLEMLRQHNAMIVATVERPQEQAGAQAMGALMRGCATRLYLPDDIALTYDGLKMNLSSYDNRLLHRMERQKGDFLLKQGGESIALRADFDEMEDVRAVYTDDVKNLIAAGGRFASLPKDD